MTRRRRGGDSPLSLFAFQDVITGITGIMILVMLLLVLEVIERKAAEAPATATSTAPAEDITGLVAAMQDEKEKLLGEIADIQKRLAGLPAAEPRQIKLDTEDEKEKQVALDKKIEQLRVQVQEREKQADEAEANAATAGRDREGLKEKVRGMEEELRKLEAENRVTFIFGETDKTPILVQCSQEGIRAKVLGETVEVERFDSPEGSFGTAVANFRQWSLTRDKDSEAFVVLVKPSSVRYAPIVVSQLRGAGFDVGHEPLEEDKTGVFGD